MLLGAACTSSASRATGTLAATPDKAEIRFIDNEYARALAEARGRHVPLFVDAWAPWCHTCMSLRSYVFPDPALRSLAGQFVWLALDTEREENAALVSKLGVRVLPTLYVIDPATEAPVLAWSGSLTASELAGLLEDAALAVRERDGGDLVASSAMLRGHRASAEARWPEATAAYRAALAAAPAGWPKRALVVDGLVTGLAADGRFAECVAVGADESPSMPSGTGLADVLRASLGCAHELPAGSPARSRLPGLVALGERIARDESQPILADDRSDLFDYVLGGLRDLGRDDDVKPLARVWAAFLERQATRAPTPAARSVFDAHRVLACKALGEPERALPALEQSERDFPDDYNPPARIAIVYLTMRRYDDALAAIDRAISRAYGPRKLRLWSIEADVHEARGDRRAEMQALDSALAFAKTVSLTAGYAKLRDAIELRRSKVQE